ncbi:MAG: zinc ribbon domain-containing protein [Chloroflexi bacterium]|nr:zinc ribbon domain-containing protein [Chloroflexota bacterium]
MDIGAIFLLLALLILVALFLAQPFMERRARRTTDEEHELSTLMAERDRVLDALQELDFDHELGKIPAEDYPKQRAALLKKGAEALRQLDAYQEGTPAADAESRLEAAIAARRADAARPVSSEDAFGDDELESLIAARRSARKEKSGGFCPHCGRPILRSDQFCPNCGKPPQ